MGKQRLKPGQHGAIFVERTGSKRWRARTRLRLFDGGAVWVARAADSKGAARLRVQDGVAERLGTPRGSIALGASSTVGEACWQWVGELRVRQAWPNAPVRPQTVDEYERNVARHVEPRPGRLRLQGVPAESASGSSQGAPLRIFLARRSRPYEATMVGAERHPSTVLDAARSLLWRWTAVSPARMLRSIAIAPADEATCRTGVFTRFATSANYARSGQILSG